MQALTKNRGHMLTTKIGKYRGLLDNGQTGQTSHVNLLDPLRGKSGIHKWTIHQFGCPNLIPTEYKGRWSDVQTCRPSDAQGQIVCQMFGHPNILAWLQWSSSFKMIGRPNMWAVRWSRAYSPADVWTSERSCMITVGFEGQDVRTSKHTDHPVLRDG